MHAALLAGCDDSLQFRILIQSQSDRDLIELILLQDLVDVIRGPDHGHVMVITSYRRIVIQDAVDLIAPLGIRKYAVDIAFCRAGIAHEDHMLQVHPPGSDIAEDGPDKIALTQSQHEVDPCEDEDQSSGEVVLLDDEQYENEPQKTYHVGKKQVSCLQHPSGHSLRLVQMESIVQKKISGDHKQQCHHIFLHGKFSCLGISKEGELYPPCSHIRHRYDQCIYYDLYPVQMFLVIFNHAVFSLLSPQPGRLHTDA